MANALYENMEGNNCKALSVINQNNEDSEDLHKLELHSFKNLWLQDALLEERSHLPDIDFITSDKCIVKAHRSILCIFSSMVRGMMENISCCQSIAILLPDCSSQALVHVLNMISTGESLEDTSETLNGLTESELIEVEGAANILGIQIRVDRKTEDCDSFGDPISATTAIEFDDDVEILDVAAVVNQVNDTLAKETSVDDYIKIEPTESGIGEGMSENAKVVQSTMENVPLTQSAKNAAEKIKLLENLLESSKNQKFRDTLMDNAYNEVMDEKMVDTNVNAVKLEIGEQLAIEAQGNVSRDQSNVVATLDNTNMDFQFGDEEATINNKEPDTNVKISEDSDFAFTTINTDAKSKIENENSTTINKHVDNIPKKQPSSQKLDSEDKHKNSCQICTNGRNFEHPTQLIQHYVFHFKKEIKENFFHHFSESLCLLCNKTVRNENKFAHIGATHKKVNDILIQKGFKQVTSTKQGLKPDKFNPKDNNPEEISTEIETQSSFLIGKICNFCQREFRNNFQTIDHMSKVHFQAEILKKYAKNGNVCTFCGVDAMIPARLASHLGYSHRKIDQFLGVSTIEKDAVKESPKEKNENENLKAEKLENAQDKLEMVEVKNGLKGTNVETAKQTEEKNKASKRTSCGKCENCTRKECRLCVNCKDMKKFGGPALIKKKCKQKKCLNPSLPSTRPMISRILSERVKSESEISKPELPRIISEPKHNFESSMQSKNNEGLKAKSEEFPEVECDSSMEKKMDMAENLSEESLVIPQSNNLESNDILEATPHNEVEESNNAVIETNHVNIESESTFDLGINLDSTTDTTPINFNEKITHNKNSNIDTKLELNNSELNQKETTSINELPSPVSENIIPENHEIQDSNKLSDSSDGKVPKESNAKTDDLECFVCDRCFSSQVDLYRHYSLKHYFEQICEKYPQQPFCPVPDCNAKTKQRMAWVRHLGQVHEVVQDFLPEQFWIEREEEMPKAEMPQVKDEPMEEHVETEKEYVNPMTIGETKDVHVDKKEENVQTPGIEQVQISELPDNSKVLEDSQTSESPKILELQQNVQTPELPEIAKLQQNTEVSEVPKNLDVCTQENVQTPEIQINLNVPTPELTKTSKMQRNIQSPELTKTSKMQRNIQSPEIRKNQTYDMPNNSTLQLNVKTPEIKRSSKVKQNVQTSELARNLKTKENMPLPESDKKLKLYNNGQSPELTKMIHTLPKRFLPELHKKSKQQKNVQTPKLAKHFKLYDNIRTPEISKTSKIQQNVQQPELTRKSKIQPNSLKSAMQQTFAQQNEKKPELTKISKMKQKIEILKKSNSKQRDIQQPKLFKKSKLQQNEQRSKQLKNSNLQEPFVDHPIIDITNVSEENLKESKDVAEPNYRFGKRKFDNASNHSSKYEEPKKRIVVGINNKKITDVQDEISATLKSTIKDIKFSDNAKNELTKTPGKRVTRKSQNFRYTE